MLYTVKFSGYYPVGAVAIVRASNRGLAKIRFLAHLAEKYPTLLKENTDLKNEDFEVLDVVHGPEVLILLDGDY